MKKGSLVDKYKVLSKDGQVTFVKKFTCPDDFIFEDAGQQYLKIKYDEKITFLLPVESVEDYFDPQKEVEEEKSPAMAILRKIFPKKVKKNLEN